MESTHQAAGITQSGFTEGDIFNLGIQAEHALFLTKNAKETTGIHTAVQRQIGCGQAHAVLPGGESQSSNAAADVFAVDGGSVAANNGGQRELGIRSGAYDAACIPIAADTADAEGVSDYAQAGAGFHQPNQAAHGIAVAGNGGDIADAGQRKMGIFTHHGADVAAAKNL